MNLTKNHPSTGFILPGVVPIARFQWLDEREVIAKLNLDGVHIDMRGEPPWRVDLTWRAWIVICPQFFKIDVKLIELNISGLGDLPVIGESGLEEAVAAPLRPPS